MSSSIGAFDFLQMKGQQVPQLAASVEIIDRPAVSGIASRVPALKSQEITKYTIEGMSSKSNANDAIDDYSPLKGNTVTVEDDLGRVVYNVLVVDVRVQRVQRVLNCSEALVDYYVYAVWLLRPTE